MRGHTYGYVRVSTREQNTVRQMDSMRRFGIEEQDIIIETESGKDFFRPEYQMLLQKMDRGDTLVVTSIDRLGRNYREILNQWRIITHEIGAAIVVLDMPLLDTRSENDLMGMLISDIVLKLLSYVAQTEREHIRQRQAEGIAAAMARGVQFGRPRIPMPESFDFFSDQWIHGAITSRNAAAELGVSHQTFLRRVHEQTMPPPDIAPIENIPPQTIQQIY